LTGINDRQVFGPHMSPMQRHRTSSTTTFPELFELFAQAILAQDMTDAAYLQLQAMGRYARATAGEAVLADGDQNQIVFVARGATKLVAHASGGREQVVAFHFEGDLVSVPARGAHSYTLCALQDCELIAFAAAEFLGLARSEPGLLNEVLERVLASLARSREKSIALGRKTAQERVASFLVSMAGRIGMPQEGGCLLHLPMSRRDMADSLGLTIETISRQLTELREAGLIETSGRSVVHLCDNASLQARAGHLSSAA
jgi:CRP-like cAMP-binding protein